MRCRHHHGGVECVKVTAYVRTFRINSVLHVPTSGGHAQGYQRAVQTCALRDEDVTPYGLRFHLLWQESSEHQAASLGHRWIRSLSEAP